MGYNNRLKGVGGNFKIKVAKNIGEESVKCFGLVGTIHDIVNGRFFDLDGEEWDNFQSEGNKQYSLGYKDIKSINKDFAYPDEYQTIFELA